MKKFVLAVVFSLVAALAMAATHQIQACTTDHKAATLTVDIADNASAAIIDNVKDAFTKAANKLTAEKLVGQEGYAAFVNGLTEESWNAIEVDAPPSITDAPQCK